VIAVQLVNEVPAHLGRRDKALLHQPGNATTDPNLRATDCLLSYLANGERASCASQYGQHRPVESRRQRPGRVSQIHHHILYLPIK
jgi:hypothetical protein